MARKTERDLAAKLKAQVALAALRGDKSLPELARQFDVDPVQIDEWKNQLERFAEAAFSGPGTAPREEPTLPVAREHATLPGSPAQPRSPTLRTEHREVPAQKAVMSADPWSDFLDDEATVRIEIRKKVGSAAADAPGPAADERASGRVRSFLTPFFVGWRERHFAARASRELLKLHRTIGARHPGLPKRELYRQIVMARLGVTPAAAGAVLDRATESFASWPVERALTFRDVVHYLVVSDYLASADHVAEWTRENLGRVVASFVPDSL